MASLSVMVTFRLDTESTLRWYASEDDLEAFIRVLRCNGIRQFSVMPVGPGAGGGVGGGVGAWKP